MSSSALSVAWRSSLSSHAPSRFLCQLSGSLENMYLTVTGQVHVLQGARHWQRARAKSGTTATHDKADELTPSHFPLPRAASYRLKIILGMGHQCPLWVKSRHVHRNRAGPLYSQKRPRKRIPAKAMSLYPRKRRSMRGQVPGVGEVVESEPTTKCAASVARLTPFIVQPERYLWRPFGEITP